MGVVNMCAEWKGPVRIYERFGVEQLRLPTADVSAPSLDSLERGVRFIRDKLAKNPRGSIFIHCKCGIGRSASILVCYMVAERGMSPEAAMQRLQSLRAEVSKDILRYESVRAFVAKHSKSR